MRRPWFRRASCSWYVEMPDGRQLPLGRDERFKAPPREIPKEPPPSIQKKYLAAMQREAQPEDRLMSFCVGEYRKSLEAAAESTRRRAAGFLDQFLASAGDLQVSKLKAHHVTDFIKGKDWTPNTIRNAMATVNACMNHCVREGWIDANPLRGKLKLPKVERRELNLTADDQEKIEAGATGPFRVFLRALRELGCRPGELGGARVEDCDLARGVLKVRNKTRNKTGQQFRPVVLTAAMIEACRELIGERTEGYLFRNSHGTPWKKSAIRNRLEKICGKLGIERVPYEWRHAWASDAINRRGINPAIVALQLGHTDLKMLMKTYLHADAEAIRKAMEGDG